MWEQVKNNPELTFEEHLRDQQFEEQVIPIILDNKQKEEKNSTESSVTPMELDAAQSIVGLAGAGDAHRIYV